MLTTSELRHILANVTYQNGYTFSVYEDRHEGPHLRIVASVLDAATRKPLDLGINSPLPPFATREQFTDWLLWRLERLASHEVREWLRYRGECVSNPHEA